MVKALRCKPEDPGIDSRCRREFFPLASDISMCPGVDSASINKYQDNPGGKGGCCARLTTYHIHVPIVKKSGGLNFLEPCEPLQACNETAFISGGSVHMGTMYVIIENYPENEKKVMKFIHGVSRIGPNTRAVIS